MYEPLTGIWRFNEKGGTYDGCITLVFDGEVVTGKGLIASPCYGEWKKLVAFLKGEGVKTFRYKRGKVWKEKSLEREDSS